MSHYTSPTMTHDEFTAEFPEPVPPLGKIRGTINEMLELADDHVLRRRNPTQAPAEFKQQVHRLIVMVARHREAWPRATWPFLEALNQYAGRLIQIMDRRVAKHWAAHFEFPTDLFLDAPLGLLESTDLFGEPCELPPPRVIPYETIAELDALPNQNNESIAILYGWKNDKGFPDMHRVQRCREGLEPSPEPRVLPHKADGLPMSMPSLANVKKLALLPGPTGD